MHLGRILACLIRRAFLDDVMSQSELTTASKLITILHGIDLCGQLSCAASTPVFLSFPLVEINNLEGGQQRCLH